MAATWNLSLLNTDRIIITKILVVRSRVQLDHFIGNFNGRLFKRQKWLCHLDLEKPMLFLYIYNAIHFTQILQPLFVSHTFDYTVVDFSKLLAVDLRAYLSAKHTPS